MKMWRRRRRRKTTFFARAPTRRRGRERKEKPELTHARSTHMKDHWNTRLKEGEREEGRGGEPLFDKRER